LKAVVFKRVGFPKGNRQQVYLALAYLGAADRDVSFSVEPLLDKRLRD
jgi:hypothetical protein